VWELVNRFMESKEHLVKTGELRQRTWEDYHLIGAKIIDVFGKGRLVADLRPADFEGLRGAFTKGHGEKARGHGPTSLSNDINRARVVFNYAYKQGLIDRPVLFGEGFKKPSRAVLRRERQKKCRLFRAKEIRAMLKIASPQLKAMVLLGINAGLGNNDCALLPLSALDLDDGWLTYPRPKTSIERRCRLWPETIIALREVVGQRPQPRDKTHADMVFLTRCREPWTPKGKRGDSPITKEAVKVLKSLKLHRPGLGFYALRHTFETVAGETADQVAVDFIMGHAPTANDMSTVDRERITDKRLYRIAKHVRRWLFRSKSSHAKQVLDSASAEAERRVGS
jgi:integrase